MSDCETHRRLAGYDVVLASNSPRRRELLGMLDIKFRVAVPKEVDESYPADMEAESVPEFLARKKAKAYLEQLWKPGELVIASDTVVIHREEVLGKPKDEAEAKMMLQELAGDSHVVVSGVAVIVDGDIMSFSARTVVEFGPIEDDEIDYYVEHYKPLDKAGAYGIQEWIGAVAVKKIEGSYYNVMGLPVQRLWRFLRACSIICDNAAAVS